MSSKHNITRGGLSGKMGGYQAAPPHSVWEGVASAIRGRRSKRKLFILLGAAAGLALAVTVGIALLSDTGQPGIVLHEEDLKNQPAASGPEEIPDVHTGPAAGIPELHDSSAGGVTGTSEPEPDDPDAGGAAGSSDPPAGPAIRNKTPGSRLEEKIIVALHEVQEEQLAEGGASREQLARETDRPGADLQEDGRRKEAEDKSISEETDSQQPRENNRNTTVVNEDSLVRLLQGDVAAARENVNPDADNPDREMHKKGKWQLGANLSPLISYRDVAAEDAAQNVAVNHSESARLTYTGGIQVSYLPSDRLTIQTGIQYNRMGVNIGEYSSFKSGWFQSELDMVAAPNRSESVVSISNSMGTVVSIDNDQFVNSYAGTGRLTDYHTLTPEEMVVADAFVERFSQTFEYLEIPFNVRYKLLDRTFDVQLMGGFSTNLLVHNSVSAIAGDEVIAIGEMQDVRTFNYSGNAGVGVVYDVFENFSLSIEPRFRYYLHSINTANLPVTRPYSFGFYTGVNYRF
ncbi:MAG: outer membrane beta-barrel protein [Bacteroidales bacterium]|nr:outer membrane beta-barrel protein [Bacteroidales bacterium]MDT8431422.1 outer membrane beta-barrel protein [Bacteroidales bacterium]